MATNAIGDSINYGERLFDSEVSSAVDFISAKLDDVAIHEIEVDFVDHCSEESFMSVQLEEVHFVGSCSEEESCLLNTSKSLGHFLNNGEKLCDPEVQGADCMEVYSENVANDVDFVEEKERFLLETTNPMGQLVYNGERLLDSEAADCIDVHSDNVVTANDVDFIEEKERFLLETTNSKGQLVYNGERLLDSEVAAADCMDVDLDNVITHTDDVESVEEKEKSLLGTNESSEATSGDDQQAECVVDNAIPELAEKGTVVVAKCNGFDPDAFKSSFFWPIVDVKKKRIKAPKEKQSTVFSGDVWRNCERKKFEEKIRLEAEKDARKVERENKREEAARIAAEKKILKEKKKLEAVKMAAEKEKNRVEKQQARAQKRTRKDTPIGKRSLDKI